MGNPNVQVTNGADGGDVFTDTAAHDGPYKMIQAINDEVVLGTIAGNWTGLSNETLGPGVIMKGHFTSVQRASGGSLACYK